MQGKTVLFSVTKELVAGTGFECATLGYEPNVVCDAGSGTQKSLPNIVLYIGQLLLQFVVVRRAQLTAPDLEKSG